jgi:SAM-dependent methyltransferase
MKDTFGKALLDHLHGKATGNLITETSISEADEVPLDYFFRDYQQMPDIERKALEMSRGRVLDVGCGSGSHSLWLQDKGLEVTAIDVSAGAVKTAKLRGVTYVRQIPVLQFKDEQFDTILLLMNGTGIFETVERVRTYLGHLAGLLSPDGQILVDSSDLQYMYDRDPSGGIWIPADRYYGEVDYWVSYNGETDDPFPMLYLDEGLLSALAEEAGFSMRIVVRGAHYDYLAQLKLR